ncbi:MAG: ABC transporter ATP-binding protein [Oscillospiraceae bacterium]|nr:ABC transporter ATP-binding protein [Candidatus Equicaccousia limihippi]
MSQLVCKNLCLGYDGKEILHSVDFSVDRGDYLCIVGENGSGKSTLMKTVLGLQSYISGEIIYGDGLQKNKIGYLPQQTVVQKDFPATVFEIVISGFCGQNGFKPFYSKAQRKKALENIERMGITHLTKRCYRELSGGQQQRALLARALCATEKMLLLDEPTAGLDPLVTADMYSMIKSLNDSGITVIMITHDINAALNYSNKILHIGSKVFFGSPNSYRKFQSGLFMNGGCAQSIK